MHPSAEHLAPRTGRQPAIAACGSRAAPRSRALSDRDRCHSTEFARGFASPPWLDSAVELLGGTRHQSAREDQQACGHGPCETRCQRRRARLDDRRKRPTQGEAPDPQDPPASPGVQRSTRPSDALPEAEARSLYTRDRLDPETARWHVRNNSRPRGARSDQWSAASRLSTLLRVPPTPQDHRGGALRRAQNTGGHSLTDRSHGTLFRRRSGCPDGLGQACWPLRDLAGPLFAIRGWPRSGAPELAGRAPPRSSALHVPLVPDLQSLA